MDPLDDDKAMVPAPLTPTALVPHTLSRRAFLAATLGGAAGLYALTQLGLAAPARAQAPEGRSPRDLLGSTPAAALQLPFWGDGANWNWPEYYETIQAGRRQAVKTFQGTDFDGDGLDELIARGPNGLLVNHFDLATGQWLDLPPGPPCTDMAGWSQPQYYQTIQCADVDGDGKVEVLGRGPDRMHLWRYDPASPSGQPAYTEILPTLDDNGQPEAWPVWSDAAGWNAPQYYETIQLADINGDGLAELIGRAPPGDPSGAGIQVWQYIGNQFWQFLWGSQSAGTVPVWTDAAGWNAPQYYETIQCADVDGDGQDELIGRAPDKDPNGAGIQVWKYDPTGNSGAGSWGRLPAGPAWTDAAGWDQVQYYSTIQTARALPGTPPAVPPIVIANPGFESPAVGAGNWSVRVGDGWSWQGGAGVYGQNVPGFNNAFQGQQAAALASDPMVGQPPAVASQQISGFAAGASYALTLYAATPELIPSLSNVTVLLDGDPVELNGTRIGFFNPGASWSQFRTATFTPGAGTHTFTFVLSAGTVLLDDVQITPVVSNQAAVLVGRDSLGMKTWRYNAGQWQQSSAAFPAFSGGQATAYGAIPGFLGIQGTGTVGVRGTYNDLAAPFQSWISDLQTSVELGRPPSGVSLADWQPVVTQIVSEMQAVINVQKWYGTLTQTLIGEIYQGKDMAVQTVGNYVSLSSGSGDGTALSIESLLFNGAWAVLGTPGLDAGNESAIAGILATAFSAAATAAGGGGTYQGAYAGLQAALTNSSNQAIAANGDNLQAITGGTTGVSAPVPGDYGLLMAIGGLVASTVWSWPEDDSVLYIPAQRQYALAVWQALIALVWWIGEDELNGPPTGLYLYPPNAGWLESEWLTNSSLNLSVPATASLSALFDTPGAGDVFPLGVPLADVYLGQNGWPVLYLQNFTPNVNSARPPIVRPALGPDVQVRARLSRDAATGEVVVTVTLSNAGLSGAANVEVTAAQLGGRSAPAGYLPTRHKRLGRGRSATVVLHFPAGVGPVNSRTVLRLSGRYLGGTFGGSYRVTLP